MKPNRILLLTLLLSGALLLAACARDVAPEEASTPESTEPVAYPYPDPGTNQGAQPDKPVSYPGPDEVANDGSSEPYPDVDAGSAGEPEVLTLADFSVMPADRALQKGPVFIEETGIVMKESYPVQVELMISGNLPTPCHQLRVITADPDADGHIQIQVYSVSDPDKMCTQVLKPFTASVPLGEYTEGSFTYSINDELDGDFQLP